MATITNPAAESKLSSFQPTQRAENKNSQENPNPTPTIEYSLTAGIASGVSLLLFGTFSIGFAVYSVQWLVLKLSQMSLYDWARLF